MCEISLIPHTVYLNSSSCHRILKLYIMIYIECVDECRSREAVKGIINGKAMNVYNI